ncbi:MAG: serine hydrolase [Actinobacteria bacterium]|nr:serine hydrolase [Actinomycetota bacterium]
MRGKRTFKKILKITGITISSFILFILFIECLGIVYTNYKPQMKSIVYNTISPDYWPTQGWEQSTPEEQGMDSGKILEMVEFYEEKRSENKNILIDSVTIIRNGYIVSEIYFNPLFPKDTVHIIQSCTKSIMSALIGIAIDQGYIKSVDIPIMDIFDDENIGNTDKRINKLTLKDLLTMQTGLHSQDDQWYEYKGLFDWQATDGDWTEYILNLPFEADPGTRFDYSNMASFLLSAIISETTGMDTLSFARKYLFDPMGIKDVRWEKSPQGIYMGFARMWLKPDDMAKIGLLYLQKGKWDRQQLVPSTWIEESLTAYSFPKKYRYIYNDEGRVDYMTSGGAWMSSNLIRPFADGYGYQWWLDKSGMYSAVGTGGQYIMIVPGKNLLVVFTGKLSGIDVFLPATMLNKYIIPSVVSDEPLPVNSTAQNKLASLSEPPQLDIKPGQVQVLPEIAEEISGKTYLLDSNPWNYNHFKLVFDPDKDYAEFSYTAKQKDIVKYQVGMDSVYRLSESNGDTYAAYGYWSAPDTFVIEYELIGYCATGKWVLTFKGDEITVEETGVTGVYNYKGRKSTDRVIQY